MKDLDLHLEARISKCQILGSGNLSKTRWSMSLDDYVKSAIAKVYIDLNKIDFKLPTKVETPLSSGYRPEQDSLKEFIPRQVNLYQGVIGTLRWICELVRIDILMPVIYYRAIFCRLGLGM